MCVKFARNDTKRSGNGLVSSGGRHVRRVGIPVFGGFAEPRTQKTNKVR